ncbi:Glycosyltransferase involved in cell wall bisynthesis [Abditibacterium utsteinense]|uniref:Glycosyltransferase involved in cell wall bisynthesis n=1 Tax=Abditibacterium utsteinense TaxID=1960156 RepID=A0A2S8SSB3_9BACT|nr:glycosyltransferase family 1 protein [Abditibacterium utsteinense]PQV63704.1 Glycosyltransferase involved in cell wall bisynthesis [Abditibacterium utsteinense]
MKKMPTILVDARYKTNPRGGDRCRFELATHLQSRKNQDFTFLAYAHARSDLQRCQIAPFLPEQHPQADWFEHVVIPRLSKQIGAAIYHGTFNVLPLRRAAPINIVTVHDMALFAMPEAYSARFGPFMRFLLRQSIRQADAIITVSSATKDEITRVFPWAKRKLIVPILNGVGKEFLDAAHLEKAAVTTRLSSLGLPDPYILFVGNLERKKNLGRLIEAFLDGKSRFNWPHSLVIVGEKPPKLPPEIAQTGDLPPSVHFTGYLPDADLPLVYRGADLVAYPSLYEGFGLPVLEGMAAGTPVLTSTVSSLPEIAGGAALLVDPFDVTAIAEALNRALSDIQWRRDAIEAGRERAHELSWAKNADETAKLYVQLAEERFSK